MPKAGSGLADGAHKVSEEDCDVRIRSFEIVPDGRAFDGVEKLSGDGRFPQPAPAQTKVALNARLSRNRSMRRARLIRLAFKRGG